MGFGADENVHAGREYDRGLGGVVYRFSASKNGRTLPHICHEEALTESEWVALRDDARVSLSTFLASLAQDHPDVRTWWDAQSADLRGIWFTLLSTGSGGV